MPSRRSVIALVPLALVAGLASRLAAQRDSARPPARLDTVRVTSRAPIAGAAATRSVAILSRDGLARLAGRSLAELVATALGTDVQARSPAQADLSIRGSTFNQVVVLVDGVRVSDVQSGHYALDLAVPTADIERIEILRGGGSALYGSDAAGGVINIVTRADAGARELAVRGGSFGSADASVLASGTVAGTRMSLATDAARSDGHRPGTDYDVTQLRTAASRATLLGVVSVDAGQGLRRFGAADFYSPYPSEETTRSTTAALRLTGWDTAHVAFSGSLHARRHADLFTLKRDDPSFYQNRHVSWETGGDASARIAMTPSSALVAGVDLLDARLTSARLGDHAQQRAAAFGELSAELPAGAVLNAGLRGDRVSGVGSFVSPALGVMIPVAHSTRLRASINRGFRAPTWTERYYRDPANVADSNLAVERFWSGEAGASLSPARGLLLDVALFERHAADLIDWAKPAAAAPAAPWQTMNFASARYRGVEASLRAPSVAGMDVELRASGLRFTSSAAAGVTGKYALRPLTRTVGTTVSLPIGRAARVTVDANEAQRASEEAHLQVNARLLAPVGPLAATLELLNIGNAGYLDASGKPVAGRSVFVGVRYAPAS